MGTKIASNSNWREDQVSMLHDYMLVRGSSSRLWNEVREKRGFAYSTSGSSVESTKLGCYFTALVETMPGRIAEVRDLMWECLSTPITETGTLEEFREWLYDWYNIGYEVDLSDWTSRIQRYFVKGRLFDVENSFERDMRHLKSITIGEVEEMRQSIVRPDHMVTVVLRPA